MNVIIIRINVRPKLEYCVQAWRPFLRQDINNLERVQHRATKMISECKGKDYEERLRYTDLISLEDRGDLIQVLKLFKGLDKIDYKQFFQVDSINRTWGHKYEIIKQRSRLEIRKHFFSQRVVNTWNSLQAHVVEAETLNSFKNRLDKVWNQLSYIRC